MEYITTKDASAKWGISPTRITILANEGRIPGAQRLGKTWLIPASATKPAKRKANHSGKTKKESIDFSFPLYHFRPDWSSLKEAQLSKQQKILLSAENAVMECRFEDAYQLLKPIMNETDNVYTEIGCLWNAGICCVSLNNTKDFSKIYLRLQMILAKDFPHRDDLLIILYTLQTYLSTISTSAKNNTSFANIHDQCLPIVCLQNGYSILTKEAMNPGSIDITLLEINLRFLENTSAMVAIAMMHCYLLGIYYLRQDIDAAKKHANLLIKITFENKLYFPLVTYYRYYASILAPILAQYPEDFQIKCNEIITQFEKNSSAFFSSTADSSIISKLNDDDYPYIYAVLMDLSNTAIAEQLGISSRTAERRLENLYEKFGVANKKALKDYLHNYM